MADAPNSKDLMTAAQACLEAGENDRALRMLESAKRQESLHEPHLRLTGPRPRYQRL